MKIRKISLETTVKGDRDLFWESEVQVLFLQINIERAEFLLTLGLGRSKIVAASFN